MVRLAYLAAVRRSLVSILLMSVSVAHFMNYTSLGAKSGLPVRYDSCCAIYSDVILADGPGL